jgi:hypothetical protein
VTIWGVRSGDDIYIRYIRSAHPAIDTAYHAKYDRHGPQIVGTVTGPSAVAVALRLTPVDHTR